LFVLSLSAGTEEDEDEEEETKDVEDVTQATMEVSSRNKE